MFLEICGMIVLLSLAGIPIGVLFANRNKKLIAFQEKHPVLSNIIIGIIAGPIILYFMGNYKLDEWIGKREEDDQHYT
jgi:formate hydrogenlyase subunit 3/multisubunit Na+/H+ antiporter MnhD subunit